MSDGTRPRSGQNSIYRNQFLCYTSRRCDRPDSSHMFRPLTAPWAVQGSIVDETLGAPETCTNDFQYEQYPWNGVCSYLEIYNPGIFTFATPCKCGTLTDAPTDINERVCIWQGERCGGNIVVQDAFPPPPSLSPFPPNTMLYPPSPFPPGLAPPPPTGLGGGAVTGIIFGCAGILALCAALGYTQSARIGRLATRAARALPALPAPPASNTLPTLNLSEPAS